MYDAACKLIRQQQTGRREEKKRKQGRKNKTPTCENPHRSLCKESNNFSKHKKS